MIAAHHSPRRRNIHPNLPITPFPKYDIASLTLEHKPERISIFLLMAGFHYIKLRHCELLFQLSEYFKAALTGQVREAQTHQLELPDQEPAAIKTFLRLAYSFTPEERVTSGCPISYELPVSQCQCSSQSRPTSSHKIQCYDCRRNGYVQAQCDVVNDAKVIDLMHKVVNVLHRFLLTCVGLLCLFRLQPSH